MSDLIHITVKDNVAVAIHPLKAGNTYQASDGITALAFEDIPQGHKIALKDIREGESIIKYGVVIGHATKDIAQGHWVHTQNMATNLSGEVKYTYRKEDVTLPAVPDATFEGYSREDGRAGVRNEIWIIPTVGCVNDVAKKLAADNQDLVTGTIDGLHAFSHPFGCSQTGADHAQTRKLLASLVHHPNAGAVLVLSLGCENLTHEQFVAELGDYNPERVRFLTCQEVSDEYEEGRKILKELAGYASSFHRETLPASRLVIGMKCGGSDGMSGITANALIGRICDAMTGMGGRVMLTEVPEMFGAEQMLMNRCVDKDRFDKTVNLINGFKGYYARHNQVCYENPSPGNKAGGITTLEDKSLGCVQKGGKAPVTGVLKYGERLPQNVTGLTLLEGPGNDIVSTTDMTAAGANIILFSTGRGTPLGAPVPTVKIATNHPLAQNKHGWIDFDAARILDEPSDSVRDALLQQIIDIVSGRAVTKNEKNGYREIAIFKDGVTL